MNENTQNVGNVLDVTVDKMRAMADADTIIGNKIELEEGVSAIPVFKVCYGFAGGGSDFATSKVPAPKNVIFAGGGGGGMTVTPVAFLVCKNGDVQILNINSPIVTGNETAASRAVGLVPDMFDKVVSLYKESKNTKEQKD